MVYLVNFCDISELKASQPDHPQELQDLPEGRIKIINSLPAPIMVKNNQPRLSLDIMFAVFLILGTSLANTGKHYNDTGIIKIAFRLLTIHTPKILNLLIASQRFPPKLREIR